MKGSIVMTTSLTFSRNILAVALLFAAISLGITNQALGQRVIVRPPPRPTPMTPLPTLPAPTLPSPTLPTPTLPRGPFIVVPPTPTPRPDDDASAFCPCPGEPTECRVTCCFRRLRMPIAARQVPTTVAVRMRHL